MIVDRHPAKRKRNSGA